MKTACPLLCLRVLALMAGVFPGVGRASAQDAARDPRRDRLPISVSLPLLVAWAPGTRSPGLLGGVTVTTQVSGPTAIGLAVRAWQGLQGQSCGPFEGDCSWQEETTGLVVLAHADFYPVRQHLFFLRAAGGITWLHEQQAAGTVIHDSRSWPITFLAGAGWDFRIRQHLFVSPLIEVVAAARHEGALHTTPSWLVQSGVALTVR